MAISISKRIRSNGRARWRAQVRVKGHRALSKTFSRHRAAEEWADQEQDRLKTLRPGQSSSLTVGAAVDRYIDEIVPTLKSGAATAAQLNWWTNQIGNVLLIEVTPALISEVLYKLERSESRIGKRSPGTVNRYHSALSALLQAATKRWHYIDSNPAHGTLRRTESRGRTRWLKDGERKVLLEACENSEWSGLRPLVLLALSTGARLGELLGLRWSDVDLKKGTAYLGDTKNAEARTLPIRGPALEELRSWGKVRLIGADALIFPANGVTQDTLFRRAWNQAVEDAKLCDFRFHDLRHSCASYLAMNGASLLEIADILGHKTLQMVQRYAHLSDDHKASVLESMTETVFGRDS